MTLVTADREFAAPPATVRRAIEERPEAFLAAGGFDHVSMGADRIEFARELGLATLELVVDIDHDADAVLAFDAVEGIFSEMRTEYDVHAEDGGSRITARTEFTLGGALARAFDGTIVSLQRRREFASQFDYLEKEIGASPTA